MSARSPTAGRPELLERPICFFGGLPPAGHRNKQKIGPRRADTSRGATQGAPQRTSRDEPCTPDGSPDGCAVPAGHESTQAVGSSVVSPELWLGSRNATWPTRRCNVDATRRGFVCVEGGRPVQTGLVRRMTVSTPGAARAGAARLRPVDTRQYRIASRRPSVDRPLEWLGAQRLSGRRTNGRSHVPRDWRTPGA